MPADYGALRHASPLAAISCLEDPALFLDPTAIRLLILNAFERLAEDRTATQNLARDLTRLEQQLDASRVRVAGLQARLAKAEGPLGNRGVQAEADQALADLAATWNPPGGDPDNDDYGDEVRIDSGEDQP